ncbi:unnamed protein product [Malus baccata var. baccata]
MMTDDEDGSLSPIQGGGTFDDCVGDADHAEAIRTALCDMASSSRKNTLQTTGWTSSEDEAEAMEQDDEDSEKSKSFRELRRAHYDEFQKVKELRRKGSLLDDEEEDEDINMDKEKKSGSSSLTAGVKEIDIDEDAMASELASQICSHLASIFTKPTHPHPPVLDLLVTELSSTAARKGRVFLYGVGREGLMLKALCMRLAHLSLSAHMVFDMNTPPIAAADLLIASAGPGGFSTVDAICSVARSNSGRVLLLTAQPETGSCARHASVVGYVPAQTMADDGGDVMKSRPLLPMGSVYEGALFVLFEMVVYKLSEVLGQSPEDAIRARHANLE